MGARSERARRRLLCSHRGRCIVYFATPALQAMVKVEFTYPPKSLHPSAAARAHHMRNEQGMSWEAIAAEVLNLPGQAPSLKAVRNAVARVEEQSGRVVPQLQYANCGRQKELTASQEVEGANPSASQPALPTITDAQAGELCGRA